MRTTNDDRTTILSDLQALRSDADQLDPRHLLERFLPLPAHERALSRDVMVVRGERGAGKSMLFKTLGALRVAGQPVTRLFDRVDAADVQWTEGLIEGFSERGTAHPGTEVVARFVEQASPEQVRVMWMGHLVGCLGRDSNLPTVPPPPDVFAKPWTERLNEVAAWVAAADAALPQLTTWLDNVHAELLTSGGEVTVLYDHLDKIGTTSPEVRERATASLLALWLSLSNRYQCLRAKIFVREDLFEASLSRSADASKLRSRSVALSWDVASLYRLLIRHMAAQSPRLREWLGETINRVPLEERAPFGYFPPDPLRATGRPSQGAFIEHLAGKRFSCFLSKLQDAKSTVVPRSILQLASYAAMHADRESAECSPLLGPKDLQHALEQTSRSHIDELSKEYAVVHRLERLRGLTVPIDHKKLVALVSSSQSDDGFEGDGYVAVEELARVGAIRQRPNEKWDVPEIYRHGYGIKRRGAVPSLR